MIAVMDPDWPSILFGVALLLAGVVLVWKRTTVVRKTKAQEDEAKERFSRGEYFGQVPVALSTGTRMTMVTIFCFVVGAGALVRGLL
ncbi:hypothetical protein GTR02_07045 [Kineococcus sp. R8]|nr:hypothetical protein [Kineococcus siccus]